MTRPPHALALADTANARLALLLAQVDGADDTQQALAHLVAENTLLRHDNAELSLVLRETQQELGQLRGEIDQIPRTALAELDQNADRPPDLRHSRTASRTSHRHSICAVPTPNTPTDSSTPFPRPLTLSLSSTASAHSRHYSQTPSVTSIRSSGNPPPPYSHTRTDSYPSLTSPRGRRTGSIDRPGLLNRGVSAIAESSLQEEPVSPVSLHERDPSHSSTSSDHANTSISTTRRIKRLSLTPSFRPPVSPLSNDGYFPSPPSVPQRKPLRLLSCSVGVQTDPDPQSTPTSSTCNKATLAGLGFEETSIASSNQSTPQFLSPYSPFPPTPNTESPDGRTSSLFLLIEHMSKILLRVRQADVPTLTRRLKKQHLAGDVGHLSSTTLKSLTHQVADIRAHFRGVLDEEKRHPHSPAPHESLVTRKDFMFLIKLFKELFTELIDLRTVVNQIILDPLSVTRLKESVQAAIDMVDPAAADQSSYKGKHAKHAPAGLGWIAAPISKLFTASSDPTPAPATPSTLWSAPKLEASTSASTTHVNVEFAGAGIIRRSTHALPVISTTSTEATDPYTSLASISPPDSLGRPKGGTIKAKPRPAITLGDGSVRAGGAPPTRAGLMSIFAGAPVPSRPTIRPKPSLDFHGTHRRLAGHHRRQISNAVDAVIDQPLPKSNEDTAPLLERTLRPRGLSDSSIRSTFQSHAIAAPIHPHRAPAAAAAAASYWPDSRSMVKTLGKRIQALTGAAETTLPTPIDGPHNGPPPAKQAPESPSTPATPVGIEIASKPNASNHLGASSYKAMGTSYMDILTSTSLITDNSHLTHYHHVPEFER